MPTFLNRRTEVVDRVEVEDPRLPFPVVVVLRGSESVELYGAREGRGGLEEYVGTLQGLYQGRRKKIEDDALYLILSVIKKRVEERPASERSYLWLRALYPSGLLQRIEDELHP